MIVLFEILHAGLFEKLTVMLHYHRIVNYQMEEGSRDGNNIETAMKNNIETTMTTTVYKTY